MIEGQCAHLLTLELTKVIDFGTNVDQHFSQPLKRMLKVRKAYLARLPLYHDKLPTLAVNNFNFISKDIITAFKTCH